MRRLVVLLLVLVIGGAGTWAFVTEPWASSPQTNAQSYRTARIERGDIVSTVNATGTINPISTVIVGSQLSGQVVEILADYNDIVRKDQILARLNVDQIRARHDGARADLAQSRAQAQVQEAQLVKNTSDVERAEATLADIRAQLRRADVIAADAEQTLARQTELSRRGVAAETAVQGARTQAASTSAAVDSARAQIRSAEAQLGSLRADRSVIEAQLASARAQVMQREAVIRQIEVDIRNSEIKSSIDGVVVQRSVELGQTVAASMTAPTLFLIAEDLRTMRIFANVDETDVGRVQQNQIVTFTVNAFPGQTFEGRVEQVRLGAQSVQNVVIYTAVITFENPNMVLKPGMTANLRIFTERKLGVLRVSNAALRWRPPSEANATPSTPAPQGGGLGLGGPQGNPLFGPGAQAAQQAQSAQRALSDFVDSLKSELRLSTEQSREVDRILADQRRNARGQFSQDMTVAQRRDAATRFREELAGRIGDVLNDQQRQGFEEIRRRLAEGRAGRQAAGAQGRVYRADEEGDPRPHGVRTGVTDGTFTEVVDAGGLEPGTEVIVGLAPRARQQAWHERLIARFTGG